MTEPRNPSLYAALKRVYGRVKTTNEGQPARITYLPDYEYGGRLKPDVKGGEYYNVDCPYCGDKRQRLEFNHLWGMIDKRTGDELLHLVHCHNERCIDSRERQLQLKARLAGHALQRRLPVATSTATAAPVAPPRLPENCVAINGPGAAAGRQYLEDRGFDVDELASRWSALYCESSPNSAPPLRRRVVIPVYGLRASLKGGPRELVLLGWQARRIYESEDQDDPKYLSARGLPKSELLYGLPQALDTEGPIVLVEGPTDVWGVGSNAVALLGKTISDRQRAEVIRHFAGRPLVVLLDADAQTESQKIAQQLRASRRAAGDSTVVVLAQPPKGKKDPGESKRGAIWRSIAAALGTTVKSLTVAGVGNLPAPAHWGDLRVIRDAEAIAKVGNTVALAHIVGGEMVLIPKDGSPRWVPEDGRQILESLKGVRRIYYDATEARTIERRAKLPRPTAFEDLRAAAHLVDENAESGLAALTQRYLSPEPPVNPWVSRTPPEVAKAIQRAQQIRQLWDKGGLMHEIERQGLGFVYRKIEVPIAHVASRMMATGVPVDLEQLELRQEELRRKLPRSKDKAKNKLSKRLDAITALAEAVDMDTGRVHPHLDPLGAVTGRFSCSAPPLQGFPRDQRDLIVAEDGWEIVEADFSQIEPRLLAELSRDPALLRVFRKGEDIHIQTAACIFGRRASAISGDEREVGKSVILAVIYGKIAKTLAEDLGISLARAEEFIATFYEKYPEVRRWKDDVEANVADAGFVTTRFGRRRRLPDAASCNRAKSSRSLRQAVNSVIQGTAADLCKLALIRLNPAMPKHWRLLLTVHDSVLLEVPQEEGSEAEEMLKETWEEAPSDFKVRLGVNIKRGPAWGSARARALAGKQDEM